MSVRKNGYDDRPEKNDFTASTVAWLEKQGYLKGCEFFEENNYGDLVPYGSPEANPYAHIDIYLKYGSTTYAIEIKGRRKYRSDYKRIIEEGTFYNIPKAEDLKKCQDKGYIPLFVEVYPDGVIRIWNVSEIKPVELPSTTEMIRRCTADSKSPVIEQERLLLAISAATEITRIKSMKNDRQRDDN